jgi:hypothetical protein
MHTDCNEADAAECQLTESRRPVKCYWKLIVGTAQIARHQPLHFCLVMKKSTWHNDKMQTTRKNRISFTLRKALSVTYSANRPTKHTSKPYENEVWSGWPELRITTLIKFRSTIYKSASHSTMWMNFQKRKNSSSQTMSIVSYYQHTNDLNSWLGNLVNEQINIYRPRRQCASPSRLSCSTGGEPVLKYHTVKSKRSKLTVKPFDGISLQLTPSP